MNEEVTTFEGLKEEVQKLEGFVEKMIPFHHSETEPEQVTPVLATDEATGVPSPAPAADPVVESAPIEPAQQSAPVHVLETRSFGRPTADHPMVINVTRGAT